MSVYTAIVEEDALAIAKEGLVPERCSSIETGTLPVDLGASAAYQVYIRPSREKGWPHPPNGLQAQILTMPDQRRIYLVYPKFSS